MTEAGREVGFGHLSRMAVLRKILTDRGVSVDLRVKLDTTTELDWDGQMIPCDDWIKNWPKNNLIIVDSYRVGLDCLAGIRAQNLKLIYMDDFGRLDPPCDLIINANLGTESFLYKNADESLVGSSFVILQEGIRKSQKKVNHKDRLHKILISMGGSEVQPLFDSLKDFCDKHSKFEFKILAPWLSKESNPNSKNIEFISQLSAEKLAILMLESDLVLTAAGQTTHELAYLAVPFIAFAISKDQEPKVDFLLKCGLQSKRIQIASREFFEDLDQAISLLTSADARKNFGRQSLSLIDDRGAERIVDHILKLS